MRLVTMWLALLVALAFARCAGSTAGLPIDSSAEATSCGANEGRSLVFEYLGGGGWMMSRGAEDAILAAPFFSNPGLLRTGLLRIRPSRDVVRRHMERVAGRERVRVVIAGHSHYDHAMDLPAVFESLPRDARLYSGSTTVNLLSAALSGRTESLITPDGELLGWTRVGNIRFKPIRSEHAPHFRGFKAFGGHVARPQATLPARAGGWKEGEPLAFLIDFLDTNGKIEFRVYYDDAAHAFPYGLPDAATLDEHCIDVAILCVASFHEVPDYPEWIIERLHPRHVLLGHWEDFFLSPDRPEQTVRLTNVHAFIERLRRVLPDGTRFTMLRRHGTISFLPPK